MRWMMAAWSATVVGLGRGAPRPARGARASAFSATRVCTGSAVLLTGAFSILLFLIGMMIPFAPGRTQFVWNVTGIAKMPVTLPPHHCRKAISLQR